MAKKWMQKAFSKNPGALHRALGVPEGKTIPAGKMMQAAASGNPHMQQMVNLAKRGMAAGGKKKWATKRGKWQGQA